MVDLEVLVSVAAGVYGAPLVAAPVKGAAAAISDHFQTKVAARLERTANGAAEIKGNRLVANERTTMAALTEAATTDDVVVQSYLSGVIAAVEHPEDDSGVATVARIRRLSGSQLRIHLVLSRAIWHLLTSEPLEESVDTGLTGPLHLHCAVALDLVDLANAMGNPRLAVVGGSGAASEGHPQLLSDLRSLVSEGLIASTFTDQWIGGDGRDPGFWVLPEEFFTNSRCHFTLTGAVVAIPTVATLELFQSASGWPSRDPRNFARLPEKLVSAFDNVVPPVRAHWFAGMAPG